MWPNPQSPVDLVTFAEETLNGILHFLCSVKEKKVTVLSVRIQYHKIN